MAHFAVLARTFMIRRTVCQRAFCSCLASLFLLLSLVLMVPAQDRLQISQSEPPVPSRAQKIPRRGSFAGQPSSKIPGVPVPPNLRARFAITHRQAAQLPTLGEPFLDAAEFPTGTNPFSVASGDFNGDGKLDIATANDQGGVSVLLGNGDGTFQAHRDYSVPGGAFAVAVGDFNRDGKPDLVTANSFANTVSVLLGIGDGTFQAHRDYPTGLYPVAVAVGDFNQDGNLDLAVVNSGDNTVSILLGNGDGTFQPHIDYPTLGTMVDGLASLVVGDFNGDGRLDLVTGFSNCMFCMGGPSSVSILLGNGDGTFQAHQDYVAAFCCLASVTAGEFNGDGHLDLAVGTFDGAVNVLLGNGDGTFQGGIGSLAGGPAGSVAVGDFNGDGKLDLAVANYCVYGVDCFNWGSGISILLGNGDGTFQVPISYSVAAVSWSVSNALTVGDFNGDQRLDVVTIDTNNSMVSMLPGNGDGTLEASRFFFTVSDPQSALLGDFNGDGKPDLVVAGGCYDWSGLGDPVQCVGGSPVSVQLGNGDGTFQAAVGYGLGFGGSNVVMGDFNADGKLDLAAIQCTGFANPWSDCISYQAMVLLGKGDGTFYGADSQIGGSATSVAAGDFNGDGKLDLVTAGGTEVVLLGNGDGTFQSGRDYDTAGNNYDWVAVADFNGDNKPDLLAGDCAGATVSVLLGNGDGTFQAPHKYATGSCPNFGTVADLNRDGKPDIITLDTASSIVSVLLGTGDGTFQPHVDYATGSGANSVVAGDFNGDGAMDIVTANGGGISLLLGNGDGTFQAHTDYATGYSPVSVTAGDLNGDDIPDLVLPTSWDCPYSDGCVPPSADGLAMILLATKGTIINLQSSTNPSVLGRSITLTATIRPGLKGARIGTPSGTMTLLDGATKISSAVMNETGIVTFSTAALATGTHSITVRYSGDTNFNPHTSAPLSQVVEGPDFGLSASPVRATVATGNSAVFAVTASGVNGFNSPVSLTCSVSPARSSGPTCTLNPTSVTPAVGGTATSMLTVRTTLSTTTLSRPKPGRDLWPLHALWLWISALTLLGFGPISDRSRKKKPLGLMLICLLVAGLSLQLACGGGVTQTSSGNSGTPAGNYAVTVGATSGTIAHTTLVTLTVQ